MPSVLVDTRPNWSRSRRTSSWRLALHPRRLAAGHSLIPLVFSVLPDPVGSGVAPRTTDHHGPPTSRSRKLSFPLVAMERIATTAASIWAPQ